MRTYNIIKAATISQLMEKLAVEAAAPIQRTTKKERGEAPRPAVLTQGGDYHFSPLPYKTPMDIVTERTANRVKNVRNAASAAAGAVQPIINKINSQPQISPFTGVPSLQAKPMPGTLGVGLGTNMAAEAGSAVRDKIKSLF